eukprot:gene4695-5863_t
MKNPCNWSDPYIWVGNQVPTNFSSVVLSINEYTKVPIYYIEIDKGIRINTFYIGSGFSLTAKGKSSDLITVYGPFRIDNQASINLYIPTNFYSISSLSGTIRISNTTVSVDGNVNMDSTSSLILSSSTLTVNGYQSSLSCSPILTASSLNISGNVNFYGRFYGDKDSSVEIASGFFSGSGGTLGSLTVRNVATFLWSIFTFYQSISTINTASINLGVSSSQTILGMTHTNSYIYQLNTQSSTSMTFVNTSALITNIASTNSQGQLSLYFHNCGNAILGTYNSKVVNTITQLSLSGSTILTLGSITNITNGISSYTGFNIPSQPDKVTIQVYNQTSVFGYSYLNNATVNIFSFGVLNFTSGFKIKQYGNVYVGGFGQLNLLSPVYSTLPSTVYSYSFGVLRLGEFSHFTCRYVNISADIDIGNSATFNSNYTFVHGDIKFSGNFSELNINVGVPMPWNGVNFKAKSIYQSPNNIININLLPTSTLQQISVAVKLTSATLNGTLNILGDSSASGKYMNQNFNVLETKFNILGDYQTNVLDSHEWNENLSQMNSSKPSTSSESNATLTPPPPLTPTSKALAHIPSKRGRKKKNCVIVNSPTVANATTTSASTTTTTTTTTISSPIITSNPNNNINSLSPILTSATPLSANNAITTTTTTTTANNIDININVHDERSKKREKSEHFLKAPEELLEAIRLIIFEFQRGQNWEFKQFKEIWKTQKDVLTSFFESQPHDPNLIHILYYGVIGYTLLGQPIITKAAIIYALYILYNSQIVTPKVQITITINIYEKLIEYFNDFKVFGISDAYHAFRSLRNSCAFIFSASLHPISTMNIFKTNTKSGGYIIPPDLVGVDTLEGVVNIDEIKNLHKEYVAAKKGDKETLPPSLNVCSEGFPDEIFGLIDHHLFKRYHTMLVNKIPGLP